LTLEGKQCIISLAFQDTAYCQKPFHKLITESGLNICTNTLFNILAADGIHQRWSTQEPFLTVEAKAAQLKYALKYWYFNFQKVLFTDESHFKASTYNSLHAKGVLR